MAKIIAKVDSVNHRKTTTTVIPGNVELSPEERKELYEFEGRALDNLPYNKRELSTTTNQGLHYFAIEQGEVSYLAPNPNISEMVAYLLTLSKAVKTTSPFIFYFSLARNPRVQSNLVIFKSLLTSASNHSDVAFEMVISTVILGNSNDLSPEVFMYIMEEMLSNNIEISSPDPIINWVMNNSAQLNTYLNSVGHELAGLPASWLLTIWGLTNE